MEKLYKHFGPPKPCSANTDFILLPVSISLAFSAYVLAASKEKQSDGKIIIAFKNSPSGR